MTNWYQEKLRRTLLDMHIEDWDPRFLADFSPEDYVGSLKIARINAPMIYIQSHVGYCYWPTASGKMHAAFRGREDAMRRLFELCHQAGMSVIAYYSLIYNNWAFEQHPDWRMRHPDGSDSRAAGGRYGLCCPNNSGYREFVRRQMAEFCAYFDFEGVFLDMTFWPMVCHCAACQARWAAETGGQPLPAVVDWRDPAWQRFQTARQMWLGEFARDMTDTLQRLKPGCPVEHQYSTALHNWRFGVNENITLASDYAGGDLYGGIAEQSFACKLYYNLTRNQPFEYMTSRCYPALSEHTSTKSPDLLTLGTMLTFLHHGACLLIDAIDPAGTHDRRVYREFGRVFGEAEKLEAYCRSGRMAYDVGLYFNLNGKMDSEGNGLPVGHPDETKSGVPHLAATLGAARALRTAKILHGVLNNWRPDLLERPAAPPRPDRPRVLVLADAPGLSEAETAAIRSYIQQGGKAYLSGHSAWPLVEEILDTACTGYTAEKITYLAPTAAGDRLFLGEFTERYPMTVFEPAVRLAGQPRGEILGTLTLPYTVPGQPRFASIHSNPPGDNTGAAALVRAPYGAGEIIWSAIPFEKADRPQHSAIFAALIRELAGPDLLLQSDGPDPVEALLFDDPANNRLLLGLVNIQETFRTIPVHDFTISIKTAQAPQSILRLPEGGDLPFDYRDGRTTVRIDRLDLYSLLVLVF